MRILIIDDNPADVNMITEIFDEIEGCIYKTQVITDGEEASKFLLKKKPYTDAKTPHLVILDLNLPRKSGHEILRDISEAGLSVPIIVYTTSDRPEDIKRAYRLKANAYVVKPPEFSRLNEVLRLLGQFWMNVAKLPQQGD
jgi:CheY-like chemotaxis protein